MAAGYASTKTHLVGWIPTRTTDSIIPNPTYIHTNFGQMEVCVGSEAQGRPVVVHPGARMERDVFPQALAQAYPVSLVVIVFGGDGVGEIGR